MPAQGIGQTRRAENQSGNHAITALANVDGEMSALNDRTRNSDAGVEEPQYSMTYPGDGFRIRKNELLTDPGVEPEASDL